MRCNDYRSNGTRFQYHLFRTENTMTARILRFFLRPEIGTFSPQFWGDFLTKLHRKPGEKGKTSTGENSKKSSGDGAPKLQISVPSQPRGKSRNCPERAVFLAQFAPFGLSPRLLSPRLDFLVNFSQLSLSIIFYCSFIADLKKIYCVYDFIFYFSVVVEHVLILVSNDGSLFVSRPNRK